jgi:predicted Ser/Thr protein kinase
MQGGLATDATVKLGESQKPRASQPLPTPRPEDLTPLFPQLEILGLLGRGGMGAVYKARQKHLNRLVALKIITIGNGAGLHFAERFQREAQALAKLNHPNIVSVFDFGETQGVFYFLMEFVDGVNLRTLIRGGEMKPEAALALIPAFCEALQYAHDEGVVHRDIKPENVLVDKKGRVKIADFGLAKLLGHEAGDLALTRTGMQLGTPRYMAPEQLDKPETVDHRADIYSLGVVFYEMLTGELPMGRFAPPSQKVQVDVRFDEIVLHALERDVKLRYQHASEIKSDVEGVTSRPMASPPSPSPQAQDDEEDAEEDWEGGYPFFAWAWKCVPLVAVLLAFFNPWGAKAWTWFAAGCAVLAVSPGIFSARKTTRTNGRASSASSIASDDDAAQPLPRFFWLRSFGLLLLGWLVVGALWNFGTPGCLFGALMLSCIVVENAIRHALHRPQWAQTWRKARAWARVYFVSGFITLGVLPFMLTISAMDVKWETSPLRWNYSAPSRGAFEASHQGKEYQLIRGLEAFKDQVPTTELMPQSWSWRGGWHIWGDSGPYRYVFGGISILASLCAVTLILFFTIQQLLGAKKFSIWRIATGGWRPALALTSMVLGSVALMYAVLNFAYICSNTGSSTNYIAKSVTVPATVQQVEMALQKWAAENGFARGDDNRWSLATVPKGQTVAETALFNAWKDSPFARWQMTPSGLRQITPHVSAQIVGTEQPLQSKVSYTARMRQFDANDKVLIDHVMQGMAEAIANAAQMNVKKPLDEQIIAKPGSDPASRNVSPWLLFWSVMGLSVVWSVIRFGWMQRPRSPSHSI